MAGYTPAFDTMLTGTLYGKWPHNGIWALLLTRVDRSGNIDETPECIAAHIGIPVKKLMESISFFMSPDPASRTKNHDGRRLELLDPERAWGWHVINHGQYREKARLMSKSAREVEEGKNAARLKDRRGPPVTAGDRPSESESESEKRERGLSLSEIQIPECPKDMDAVIEHGACAQYYGERQQAVTPSVWRSWVLRAVKSGVYARRGSRPPTEAEIQATRRACIARMAAEG